MFRSPTFWLTTVASMLVGFASSGSPAIAQTTYLFNANYDISATAKELAPDLQQILVSGLSTDAPYGLSQTDSLSYSQTNFDTGFYSFNTEPTIFGLKDLPSGFIAFAGSDDTDKLFGSASGTGLIDFKNFNVISSGTVSITGGTGKFNGAIGTLAFSQIQPLSIEIGVSLQGSTKVNGSIQTVPEPENVAGLISAGMMGAYFLLRGYRKRATSS